MKKLLRSLVFGGKFFLVMFALVFIGGIIKCLINGISINVNLIISALTFGIKGGFPPSIVMAVVYYIANPKKKLD